MLDYLKNCSYWMDWNSINELQKLEFLHLARTDFYRNWEKFDNQNKWKTQSESEIKHPNQT